MQEFIVKKSKPLCGSVDIAGSKNGALPVLAATILAGDTVNIKNLPRLTDIERMLIMLDQLGANITNTNDIYFPKLNSCVVDERLASKMRGSFLLAGPILAREGHVRISMPGGCPIGLRPVDLHLKGFSQLGANIEINHGYIDIKAKELKGTHIYLDFPSVGATENIMMAASRAKGETIIENASAEPEIAELAEFLNGIGACVSGAGTDTIYIEGKSQFGGTSHSIIPDRIEAGTYLLAFAITHGKGRIKNVYPSHVNPVVAKLREMGAVVSVGVDYIDIDASGDLFASDIKTMPFPGFPTDMQAPFMALLSMVQGTSIIVETVFENRFLHVSELNRMGTKIKTEGRTAIIEGISGLTGAKVDGRDLRGGAALILAGCIAEGETVISGVDHICRGYEDIESKLSGIGCSIDMLSRV